MALTGLALGCGGESDVVVPRSDQVTSIDIQGTRVVTLDTGASTTLHVAAYDGSGAPVEGPLDVQWSSRSPDLVVVEPSGLIRADGGLGQVWVFAEVDGLVDSVSIWVQQPDTVPSTFEITLLPTGDVPAWWLDALEAAAARWEEVIRAPLPAVRVDEHTDHCSGPLPVDAGTGEESGVRIVVTVSDQFPDGTYVEAVGGPCINRGLPRPTTLVGQIILNRDKFDTGIEAARLDYVAHHEMGHTFGLVGVVQGQQPHWLDPVTGTYTGHLALFGYRMDTGTSPFALNFSDGSHWDGSDLMGNSPSLRIRNVTVGALMDLGYPAAWYGSGPVHDP